MYRFLLLAFVSADILYGFIHFLIVPVSNSFFSTFTRERYIYKTRSEFDSLGYRTFYSGASGKAHTFKILPFGALHDLLFRSQKATRTPSSWAVMARGLPGVLLYFIYKKNKNREMESDSSGLSSSRSLFPCSRSISPIDLLP